MMALTNKKLEELSQRYGDSFYILDEEQFEQNYIALSNAFKKYYGRFNIAYSYKTNYTPRLVQLVDKLGGYAEVVSDMELEIARRSGVRAEHIIWNGPVKNRGKVKELLLIGGTVNVDTINELDYIVGLSDTYPGHTLNVGIRINYDVGDGVISRFGIDSESDDFKKALMMVAKPGINLINLQAHFAKRSPEFWTARAEGMLKAYDKAEEYGLKPRRLDIGGGIYGENMSQDIRQQLGIDAYTFDDYARKAASLFAEKFGADSNAPYLFIEPGTAVAADCMKFVCRVETIKEIRGKNFATVLGSQKNISVPNRPPMEILPAGCPQEQYDNLDIVGFTCIEGDVLYEDYSGPLAVGDYVVIGNCGSYSIVMKPPFILPNFPIVKADGELIKRAEVFDDLFHTFVF